MQALSLRESRIGHLILSPSVKDEEKFKAFTPFIINWIELKKSITFYTISEEYGDNNHYHLDIVLFSGLEINKNILNNKGKQIGLAGHLKDYMTNNLPNTQWNRFYRYQSENIKNTKDYNMKFLIGYNFKEGHKNWNNLNFTSDEINECIQFYEANETKSKIIIDKDVIPLNPKNAMFELKKLFKNSPDINIDKLKSETIKKNYCWLGMSKRNTRQLYLQLKIHLGIAEDHEIHEFDDDLKSEITEQHMLQLIEIRNQPDSIRYQLLLEQGLIKKSEYKKLLEGE